MINEQLIAYIKQQLRAGISKEEIKNILLANNWQEGEINETFIMVEKLNQPISQSTQESFTQPQNKSNKLLKVIIFSGIALTLIVSSVFGYFYYLKSPQRIIEGMFKNMTEVKSLDYEGRISTQIESAEFLDFSKKYIGDFEKGQGNNFLLNINGSFDISDLNNLKLLSAINASSGFFKGKAGIEIKTTDNICYLKINNVPNFPILIDLSFLENQWIKFDLNEIKNYAKESGLEKGVDEFGKQQAILNEKKEQVKNAIKKANIYIITKSSNSQIDGKLTHHYEFTLSKEKLINLFLEINRIMRDNSFTEKEINELEELLKRVEMPTGEIWIGKEDLLLYKMIINLNLNDEKIGLNGKISIAADFNNHNKSIKVDTPSSAKTIEEVVDALNAANVRIKFLLDEIRMEMENFKSKSATSSYIITPNANAKIIEFVSEIDSLNKNHNFVIYSNGKKWCTKANLIMGDTWCADSSGYSGTGICNDKSYQCE